MAITLDRGHRDGATGKPRSTKLVQRVLPRNQCPHPGRIAKHLVERERDVVRLAGAEVETVGRDEGRGIDQNVPSKALCARDPLQRMLHTREVRLGRKREQVVTCPVTRACRWRSTVESSATRSGGSTGMYRVWVPWARSNSRMPLTELWLSKVRRNWSPDSNG